MDLLRGMGNAGFICPMLFSFPLLALHAVQEEEFWKIESRKHQESLHIVLQKKTKNTWECVCACVFDL